LPAGELAERGGQGVDTLCTQLGAPVERVRRRYVDLVEQLGVGPA